METKVEEVYNSTNLVLEMRRYSSSESTVELVVGPLESVHLEASYNSAEKWALFDSRSGDPIEEKQSGGSRIEFSLSELKSLRGDEIVDTFFFNNTPDVLDIFWLNYNGNPVKYATIQPATTFGVRTYKTHPWSFRVADTSKEIALLLPSHKEAQKHLVYQDPLTIFLHRQEALRDFYLQTQGHSVDTLESSIRNLKERLKILSAYYQSLVEKLNQTNSQDKRGEIIRKMRAFQAISLAEYLMQSPTSNSQAIQDLLNQFDEDEENARALLSEIACRSLEDAPSDAILQIANSILNSRNQNLQNTFKLFLVKHRQHHPSQRRFIDLDHPDFLPIIFGALIVIAVVAIVVESVVLSKELTDRAPSRPTISPAVAKQLPSENTKDPLERAQLAILRLKAPLDNHPYVRYINQIKNQLKQGNYNVDPHEVIIFVADVDQNHGEDVVRTIAGPVGLAQKAKVRYLLLYSAEMISPDPDEGGIRKIVEQIVPGFHITDEEQHRANEMDVLMF